MNKESNLNKKILFISSNIGKERTGASICSMRNLEICETIFGKKNLIMFSLSSFSIAGIRAFKKALKLFNSIINLICGYSNGSTKKVEKEICNIIKDNHIHYVFIDSSLNGTLIKRIKNETNAYVLAFFHNCEKYMIKGEVKSGNFLSGIRFFSVCSNERKTCYFADKIIALNQRDSKLIEAEYKRKADLLLPISLADSVDEKKIIRRRINTRKKGLFVGSYFFGNIEGLSFFIHQVLPFVEMDLIIVGRGMSKLKIDNPNIIIYDGVEDIASFYFDADFVIAPIISGGGMKVKIAEAMMYGKVIVGTKEAFQGYENVPGLYICRNALDFIQTINSLSGYLFNTEIRNAFLEKYEINSSVKVLSRLFS